MGIFGTWMEHNEFADIWYFSSRYGWSDEGLNCHIYCSLSHKIFFLEAGFLSLITLPTSPLQTYSSSCTMLCYRVINVGASMIYTINITFLPNCPPPPKKKRICFINKNNFCFVSFSSSRKQTLVMPRLIWHIV